MEIKITEFFNNAAPMDYSASVAEIGSNAGPDTWRAAVDDSEEYQLLTSEEQRQTTRDYFATFGAWSDDEIAGWSDTELNALLIQFIAGDMRDYQGIAESDSWDWKEYEQLSEEGTTGGQLFEGANGEIYAYIGE